MHKNLLERQFSVQALTEAELLAFSYQDLQRMSQEFSECYDSLFEESVHLFRRVLLAKLLAIKHCRNMTKNKNVGIIDESHVQKGNNRRMSVNTQPENLQFDAFELEQVGAIESDDILTSDLSCDSSEHQNSFPMSDSEISSVSYFESPSAKKSIMKSNQASQETKMEVKINARD